LGRDRRGIRGSGVRGPGNNQDGIVGCALYGPFG
jgi:hypothetical protein